MTWIQTTNNLIDMVVGRFVGRKLVFMDSALRNKLNKGGFPLNGVGKSISNIVIFLFDFILNF